MYKKRYLDCLQDIRSAISGPPGLAHVDSRARKPAVPALPNSSKKYTLVPHKQKFSARQCKACTKNKKHV
jgi:hypothetical protein